VCDDVDIVFTHPELHIDSGEVKEFSRKLTRRLIEKGASPQLPFSLSSVLIFVVGLVSYVMRELSPSYSVFIVLRVVRPT
jgi:hypothetical protein